jgi:hypothetical protein
MTSSTDSPEVKDASPEQPPVVGTEGEAIGRPGDWGENRYEQAGEPVTDQVSDAAEDADKAPDTVSTPVTRRDYEDSTPPG